MTETATREQIVGWFLELDDKWELMRVNWNHENQFTQVGMWNVTDETRVNGIVLIVDNDDYKGYLLELVERASNVVSYVAIATYYTRCQECDLHPHDSMWYPEECGTLDEREAEQYDAAAWAVSVIYGMFENAHQTGVPQRHREGCSRYEPEEVISERPLTDDEVARLQTALADVTEDG